jgi:hypothetical protein
MLQKSDAAHFLFPANEASRRAIDSRHRRQGQEGHGEGGALMFCLWRRD